MIKTRTWIITVAVLLAVSAALTVWLYFRRAPGTVANIYKDGECVRSIDLKLVTAPYSFTISDERGENTILVEPGRICVIYADCPDGVCVDAGWLSDSASPIVCLPHRLVIRLEASAQAADALDAVSQ